MTVLEKICRDKRAHVENMKQKRSQNDLVNSINNALPRFTFEKALLEKKAQNKISIIAEIKKASPSKGVIRENFDPASIAKNYDSANATCISCLTDEPYFQGKDEYFTAVKKVTSVPALRKDFMIDPYQIYESRVLGADAILIIMAALNDDEVKDMFSLGEELGMSTLFEVHNQEELDRALEHSPRILGVNNRNLKTLDVSLKTSEQLIQGIPSNIVRISESGISTKQDIAGLREIGFDGFLIGESLMNKQSEEDALGTLLNA